MSQQELRHILNSGPKFDLLLDNGYIPEEYNFYKIQNRIIVKTILISMFIYRKKEHTQKLKDIFCYFYW